MAATPTVLPYQQGAMRVPAVDQQLIDRDEFLVEIRDRLEQVQQVYKQFYDKKHRELVFSVGDWVWLCLIHRPVAGRQRAQQAWAQVLWPLLCA
jgi:hypothetical protein